MSTADLLERLTTIEAYARDAQVELGMMARSSGLLERLGYASQALNQVEWFAHELRKSIGGFTPRETREAIEEEKQEQERLYLEFLMTKWRIGG